MSISDIVTIAGVSLTAIGAVSGVVVWLMRSTLAPLQVVIENNTAAINKVLEKVDDHDVKLEDHGNRLVKIETTHALEAEMEVRR